VAHGLAAEGGEGRGIGHLLEKRRGLASGGDEQGISGRGQAVALWVPAEAGLLAAAHSGKH
jgi:hypothetical protein